MRLRGLSREQVADDQRERIHAALASALARHGYERATVEQIIGFGRVSRRTFYDPFSGKGDAFLSVYEEALSDLGARVATAATRQHSWPGAVAAGVEAALDFATADPDVALLLCGGPATVGPWAAHVHDRLIARFEPPLRRGRRRCAEPRPSTLEEMLLGGAAGLLATRLRSGGAAGLSNLAPPLAEFMLVPYVGRGGAREAARRALPRERRGENSPADSLE